LWLLPRMAEFPKDQRFLLADRIEHTLLDVLERLIEAVYRKDKIPLLRQANLGLEKARFLMRMAKDMKYISLSRHTFFCKSTDEIGRMIGGWVKFQKLTKSVPELRYSERSEIAAECRSRSDRPGTDRGLTEVISGNQGPRVQGCGERGSKGEVQTP